MTRTGIGERSKIPARELIGFSWGWVMEPQRAADDRRPLKVCAVGLRGIPDVMGGIETHCEHLYKQMRIADPDIAVTVIGRSPYVTAGNYDGVEVLSVWAPKQKFLETLVHTPLALFYARWKVRADILHLHGIGPGFYAPLARLLGFTLISTHHALDYDRPKWGLLGRTFLRCGEYMLAKFSHQIICVSDVVRSTLSGRYRNAVGKSTTIRNGAPPPPEALPESNHVLDQLGLAQRPCVLAVGRLDSTKGFDLLIDAFKSSRIADTHTLVIAGGGQRGDPYVSKLKRMAQGNIRFIGMQPASTIRRLYERAALFVHPSHLEGFPLVVMEALGAGAPIVLSSIGPHKEVGLPSNCYFEDGNLSALQAKLDAPTFAEFKPRGVEGILAETAWPNLARRHLELFRQTISPAQLAEA